MIRLLGVVVAVFVVACVPVAAWAQRPQDLARCEGKERLASPEVRLRACTVLIDSGLFPESSLVELLIKRADVHSERRDSLQAINDLTRATAIDPRKGLPARASFHARQADAVRSIDAHIVAHMGAAQDPEDRLARLLMLGRVRQRSQQLLDAPPKR